MTIQLGTLQPLVVPWQIPQSVTNFGVCFQEQVRLEVAADVNSLSDHDGRFESKRIRLSFVSPAHVSLLAAIGVRASVDLSNYAISIPSESLAGGTDRGTMRKHWLSTGICPYPNAYKVVDSKLLADLGIESTECTEYVLVGQDWSIIVAAKAFTWEWHI